MWWFLHPAVRGVHHDDLRFCCALAELARLLLDECLPALGNRVAGTRLAAPIERRLKEAADRAFTCGQASATSL